MTDKKIKQHIIMKRFLYPIALTAVLMAAASCNDRLSERDLGDFPPSGGMAAVSISCKPLPSEEAETRSKFAYGDVERKKMIRSVQVFVYGLDGALAGAAYWDNGTPVARFTKVDLEEMLDDGTLDEETPYVFFFLGNLPQVPSQEIPSTAEAMEGWTYGFSDYSTFDTYGFPMAAVRGKGEGAKVYDLVGQEIELLRLVSQWTVNFQDAESGLTYDIVRVNIRNAARTVQPFSDAPAPAEVFDSNEAEDGDSGAVSIGENGVMFYVLENMQGEAFPNAVSYGDRELIGNITKKVTYIELMSSAQVAGTPLYIENTIYRYALGEIEGKGFTNADVERHTEFSLNLNFSSAADESSPGEWQKEVSDPYINTPHIGFDYDGAIINFIDGYLPFDNETKSMNAYGQQITVEWADGTGPVGDTGEPLVVLSVDNGGVRFAPSPALEAYRALIAESEQPQDRDYAFAIERGGVNLGNFVEELNEYEPKRMGRFYYIGIAPSLYGPVNFRFSIKLTCTNSFSPYNVSFPVSAGPLSMTISSRVGWTVTNLKYPETADWKVVGDAGFWWYFANRGVISVSSPDDYCKYCCPFRIYDSFRESPWTMTPNNPRLRLCYEQPTTHQKTYTTFSLSTSVVSNYYWGGEEFRMYSKDWFDYIPKLLNEIQQTDNLTGDNGVNSSIKYYSMEAILGYENPALWCSGGKKLKIVEDFDGIPIIKSMSGSNPDTCELQLSLSY